MSAKNIVRISASTDDLMLFKDRDLEDGSVLGFPELRINVDFPEQVIKTKKNNSIKEPAHSATFFLTPFREYSFQVSRTIDGQWDCGCSVVLNLHNLIHISDTNSAMSNVSWEHGYKGRSSAIHYIVKGIMLQAIEDFIARRTSNYDGYTCDWNSNGELSRYLEGDILDIFTRICIAYLFIRERRPDMCDDDSLMKYYTTHVYNEEEETDPLWNLAIPMDLFERYTSEK